LALSALFKAGTIDDTTSDLGEPPSEPAAVNGSPLACDRKQGLAQFSVSEVGTLTKICALSLAGDPDDLGDSHPLVADNGLPLRSDIR
jgi:hypothetical protein